MNNKLKAKIIEKGYTLKDVSQATGIAYQTLSNWCNNRNTENFEKLYKVLKFLNIDIKDLFD